jgi:hypothetical protein
MTVMGIWNNIEHSLAHLMAILSGSNPFDVAVTLNAVGSNTAKLALINKTGQRILADFPEDLQEFQSIMNRLSRRLDFRNKISHHLYALKGKDKIYLINPRFDIFDPNAATLLSITLLEEKIASFRQDHGGLTMFTHRLASACPLSQSYAFRRKQHEEALRHLQRQKDHDQQLRDAPPQP